MKTFKPFIQRLCPEDIIVFGSNSIYDVMVPSHLQIQKMPITLVLFRNYRLGKMIAQVLVINVIDRRPRIGFTENYGAPLTHECLFMFGICPVISLRFDSRLS